MKQDKYSKVKEFCKEKYSIHNELSLKNLAGGWDDFPKVLKILEKIKNSPYKGNNTNWYKPVEDFLKNFENSQYELLNIFNEINYKTSN